LAISRLSIPKLAEQLLALCLQFLSRPLKASTFKGVNIAFSLQEKGVPRGAIAQRRDTVRHDLKAPVRHGQNFFAPLDVEHP
jgi:hypothetical protein